MHEYRRASRHRRCRHSRSAALANGGEVLVLLTLAVHAAIPLEQLRSMINAYPTFHRGIEDAL